MMHLAFGIVVTTIIAATGASWRETGFICRGMLLFALHGMMLS